MYSVRGHHCHCLTANRQGAGKTQIRLVLNINALICVKRDGIADVWLQQGLFGLLCTKLSSSCCRWIVSTSMALSCTYIGQMNLMQYLRRPWCKDHQCIECCRVMGDSSPKEVVVVRAVLRFTVFTRQGPQLMNNQRGKPETQALPAVIWSPDAGHSPICVDIQNPTQTERC